MQTTADQALTALQRKAHEKRTELLASPDCAEAIKYQGGRVGPDEAALVAQLWRQREALWTDSQRLYERFNIREDDMEIVVPELDVPLPPSFSSLRFMGMRLVLGPADERYRVRRVEVAS